MSSTPAPGAGLVVVSNRGPLGFARDGAGDLTAKQGGGGLVVTIGPGARRDDALWIAAALGEADREAAATATAAAVDGEVRAEGFRWLPVLLEPAPYRAFYDVVANGALWYCVHGLWDLPRRPRFDRFWHDAWASYRAVNATFAAAVAGAAAQGATVLIQDYHLALVGAMLAERRPDLRTSLFVHTPWCAPGELAVLPDRVAAELLTGMAGAGAVGFHSPRWSDAFADCCGAFLRPSSSPLPPTPGSAPDAGGPGSAPDAGAPSAGAPEATGPGCAPVLVGPTRVPPTFVAPAGSDADSLRATAASAACGAALATLAAVVGARQLIVRVDRIELSKNILRGFWAFDELLETHPALRGRVSFGAFVYPSRQGLADYLAYGQEVRTLAEVLNAKWASGTWTPILLDTSDNYAGSVAALRHYDVLLVNPVRDGLNLVAHEGPLVNERNGTLVLSRQAGSWRTLGAHALGVNPFDLSETAAALATALQRSAARRAEAAAGLRAAAAATTPLTWWDAQIAAAAAPRPARS